LDEKNKVYFQRVDKTKKAVKPAIFEDIAGWRLRATYYPYYSSKPALVLSDMTETGNFPW
jgi:hypothetical protein